MFTGFVCENILLWIRCMRQCTTQYINSNKKEARKKSFIISEFTNHFHYFVDWMIFIVFYFARIFRRWWWLFHFHRICNVILICFCSYQINIWIWYKFSVICILSRAHTFDDIFSTLFDKYAEYARDSVTCVKFPNILNIKYIFECVEKIRFMANLCKWKFKPWVQCNRNSFPIFSFPLSLSLPLACLIFVSPLYLLSVR